MTESAQDNTQQAALEQAHAKTLQILTQAAIASSGPPGATYLNPTAMLHIGRQLRDGQMWRLPILPGAVSIFQDLASTREWVVVASEEAAKKGLDVLNGTRSTDIYTGMTEYGIEAFAKRRSLDFLAVGRTTMAVRQRRNAADLRLDYIDPTELFFHRDNLTQPVKPVRPTEKVWRYGNGENLYRSDEIFFQHPHPIGHRLFIAPITFVVPAGLVAELILEHDAAAIDGRKIRDIFMVGNATFKDAIEEAIAAYLSLWTGADVSKVGIPVIQVNNPSGQPLENYVTKLGISSIPESLDREQFTFYYVNIISGALGLSLRHFWNNERTTNRALEIVQEQRQLQKGPSVFVRTEQRLINQTGILPVTTGDPHARFAFIEETDSSSLKTNAEVLELHSKALLNFTKALGVRIDPEQYFSWLQRQNLFVPNLQLNEVESEEPTEMDTETTRNPDEPVGSGEGVSNETSAVAKSMGHNQVMVNQDGVVIERRGGKAFFITQWLEDSAADQKKRMDRLVDAAIEVVEGGDTKVAEQAYDEIVKMAERRAIDAFAQLIVTDAVPFDSYVKKHPGKEDEARSRLDIIVRKVSAQVALTDEEHTVVQTIVLQDSP
jgi:hypothetical protein